MSDSYLGLVTGRTIEGTVVRGVAFLVSIDIILTAACNLWDRKGGKMCRDIRFYPGSHGKLESQKYYIVGKRG